MHSSEKNAGFENSADNSPIAQHDKNKKGPIGPVVGALIIIALMLFGALYFWGAYLNNRNSNQTPLILGDESGQNAVYSTSTETSTFSETSTSDAPDAIAQDAENTNFASFETQMEADLQAFENEFSE